MMKKFRFILLALGLISFLLPISFWFGYFYGRVDEVARNLPGRLELYLCVNEMHKYIYARLDGNGDEPLTEEELAEMPCSEGFGPMLLFGLVSKYYSLRKWYDLLGHFDGRFYSNLERAVNVCNDLELAQIPVTSVSREYNRSSATVDLERWNPLDDAEGTAQIKTINARDLLQQMYEAK